ncbi:mandelate racemase/muconate lactonizing enzyme family protein [Sphingomonas koreensis]|uniref:Mandelate racemase/muconate lactonizing enzyme family protein n=1 Tax=Sphingomonas koreensis TaxID=93064 RepID=A0A2M8WEL2_9SPHN|nr:mandelate racemase/muconate lactonizing enzyme family protein [Sphingomonas koreensis]PJI89350.1 L-alanine-DL-glutamate epimerase-like enolase superfamily enzyme [Sphingomonas koreensis]RSU59227.1 mandelate racemase/muconate lactonizing enzyme family protein [Sphingomonas koreensis]RSU68267.1 mandelate racemase/muconate lactonizing enzyme family protein [Sphingomonas koreensis]RSY76381.1 mandelate racemase/muconate lactonizing enzyme family protein [Sphingomonas koreensis]
MKITGYRSLTTTHDWGRPVGDVNGVVESGVTEVPILLLETDGGLTGIGLGQHVDIARVFPAVEGQDPRAVTALYDSMLAHVFKSGHAGATYGAIAAIDMALWDLKAKMADEPLWRTLGALDRFVPGYASGLCYGLPDDAFAAHYRDWASRGFSSAKIKGGRDTARDIGRLLTARDILSVNTSRPAMMLDVNEAWNVKQAVRHLAEIEAQLDLTWIEEPVRRWDAEGHARISRACRAAVATGENLTGLDQFTPLFDARAVDVVQTGSVWGITHFLRVATAAHARNLPVSPVGYNANPVAHAAAAMPNMIGIEVQDWNAPRGLKVDQVVTDGGIRLGDAPGLGIEIDEAALANGAAPGWNSSGGPHRRPRHAGLRLVPDGPQAAE